MSFNIVIVWTLWYNSFLLDMMVVAKGNNPSFIKSHKSKKKRKSLPSEKKSLSLKLWGLLIEAFLAIKFSNINFKCHFIYLAMEVLWLFVNDIHLDEQIKSGRAKYVDSETILQAIERMRWARYLTIQCFVAFTTLANTSGAAKLCLTYYQNMAKFLTRPNILNLLLRLFLKDNAQP